MSAASSPYRPPIEPVPREDTTVILPEPAAPVAAPRSAARRASRRATALDAQKRSFLRMVSHELRTPLNAIIGFSEIIACELYGPLGAPQYKQYAEHVRSSGHKLLRLVNQVLEIARLEGHALDVEPRNENLDHALDDALAIVGEEIATRGAHIEVIAPDGQPVGSRAAVLPHVSADPRGLRTMLVNLIQNAVMHGAPTGAPHLVTVRVRKSDPELRGPHGPEAPPGAWVEVSVEDHGPGVAEQDMARLLRPFEQGEGALTRTTEGAGLGLPIVRLLAQAMGGSLRLRSEAGRGFIATVTLPAA